MAVKQRKKGGPKGDGGGSMAPPAKTGWGFSAVVVGVGCLVVALVLQGFGGSGTGTGSRKPSTGRSPMKRDITGLTKAEICEREHGEEPFMGPGDVNRVFERIATDPTINAKYNVTVVSRDPWIVTLDDFITREESNALIKTLKGKFEESTTVGAAVDVGELAKVKNPSRTSRNAWCYMPPCVYHENTLVIQDRIAEVTMSEVKHQEFLQVLNYQPGQFYKQHHDFIEAQLDMGCGPRVFTAFMYFNDVKEGGGTRFNKLDIVVQPKAGRMLLWAHVMNDDPETKDHRTDHEAEAVIKGRKMAANAWIHLYDFRKYNAHGCTGG
jgi:hypothetical protein